MEFVIKTQKENGLLKRMEVVGEVVAEKATPSVADVRKACAQACAADESLVVVDHIYPEFGTLRSQVIARVYADKAAHDAAEAIKKKPKKKKGAEAAAPEKKK